MNVLKVGPAGTAIITAAELYLFEHLLVLPDQASDSVTKPQFRP